MEIEVTREDLGDHGRYHLLVDGEEKGELDYRMVDGLRVMFHTGVREELEGRVLGGTLARHALDDAREDGVLVVPQCPFIARYIEIKTKYQDLLANAG